MSEVRKQTLWTAAFILTVAVCILCDAWGHRDDPNPQPISWWTIAAGFLTLFGGAAFVVLDCDRLGRQVGAWIPLTLLFGPGAVCVYLASVYKDRSLFMIPLVVLVYGGVWVGLPIGMDQLLRTWS